MLVALLFILGGIWLFGERIRRLRFSGDVVAGDRFARSFRVGAIIIAIAAFMIGTLYRLHVLPLVLATSLYIPVAVGFFWGLRWLQPYLHETKEDIDHD